MTVLINVLRVSPTGAYSSTLLLIISSSVISEKIQEKIYTGSFLQLMFLEFHQLVHIRQHYL